MVWDIITGKKLTVLLGHTDKARDCSFSPDGRKIVTGSDDGSLKIWDTNTGKELFTFKGFTGAVTTCTFSPDGTHIILGDEHGQILLLSLENFLFYPIFITPYKRFGRFFYRCRYCQKKGHIKSRFLGQEIICSHCKRKIKINVFYPN